MLVDSSRDSRVKRYVPAVQLDDDLAGTVVIDLLELANVACKKKMSACCEDLKVAKY